MKKEAILMVALLVLALPVLAYAQDAEDDGLDDLIDETDDGLAGDSPDGAEDESGDETDDSGLDGEDDEGVDVGDSSTRPEIHALGVLGKGIAVSPSDPMDFILVKLGLGAVKVTIDGEVRKAAIGIAYLDGVKYRVKDVSVEDGQATGDLYDPDGNKDGSFDVSSVQKEDIEVWAGTLTLDGRTWHLYIIEGTRKISAGELRDKVSDYCRNNPEDTNCRDRVEQYCGNNPDDSRCKALFRKYCIAGSNMDDIRCREYVRDYCEENPSLSECVTNAVKRSKAYCEENPDAAVCKKIDDTLVSFCRNNPDNAGCVKAKEMLQNKEQLLNRLRQFVKKDVSELQPEDAANIEFEGTEIETGED